MGGDILVKVEHVSKKYCKSLKRSMFYGMQDIGRNLLGQSSHSEELRKDEFWAVNDVSFELKKGETLGLIGPNGSGKTTMLKMINGIFWPDKGKITVAGCVGALIAVGAGFHVMLTGRENIYINAAILGMTKREVDSKFDEIVEFSEIGDFLDVPVKHYSSGMFVRLGFAVAVHCRPDILLVDEILAVGDMGFQRKSYRKMKELLTSGASIILVSHNIRTIQDFCQKSILLDHGKPIIIGNSPDVAKTYIDRMTEKAKNKEKSSIMAEGKGREGIYVTRVVCLDRKEQATDTHAMNEPLRIRIDYKAPGYQEDVHFQVGVFSQDGTIICCCNSKLAGYDPFEVSAQGTVDLVIDEELMPGNYSLAGVILGAKFGETLNAWGDADEKRVYFSVKSALTKNKDAAFWGNLGLINMRQKWSIAHSKEGGGCE